MKKAAPYVFLIGFTIFFCWLFCWQYGVFGSKVDWISQHSVLPEYFRQQFYDTGQLFPEFAANIGGGQNIYNFAYYGLYSPIILPSYLLSFVKMSDYMMAAQFLCLLASVLMMYRWLKSRDFSEKICIGVSIIFLLAGPVIYQSYNQIMFVDYMPFLCMGFYGVDRYFACEKESGQWRRRMGVLFFGTFLMIMTSFYYSICGMLVLVVYAIYRYFRTCERQQQKVTVGSFLSEGIRFLLPLLAAVMASGVLLVPTALALTKREGTKEAVNVLCLFLPSFSIKKYFYLPYGIGGSVLVLSAVIAMLAVKRRSIRILAWECAVVLSVPLFSFLLNGGLYARSKILIPFLPVLCYLLAHYLQRQERQKYTWYDWIPYGVVVLLMLLNGGLDITDIYCLLRLLDCVVILLCYGIFVRCGRKNVQLLIVPTIVILGIYGGIYQEQEERAVTVDFYEQITDTSIGELISEVEEQDTGFYRMEQVGTLGENAANLNRVWNSNQYITSLYSSAYNGEYMEFRRKIFRVEQPFRNFLMQSVSQNPVYQRLMGVKYLISKDAVQGYELQEQKGEWSIYKNEEVAPLAYETDRLMTEEEYEKLEFPYQQLALLRCAVTEEAVETKESVTAEDLMEEMKETTIPIDFVLPVSEEPTVEDVLTTTDEGYHVTQKEDRDVRVELPDLFLNSGGRTLFLQFEVKNNQPKQDVSILLEGVRNKLTDVNHTYYNGNTVFTYAVALKPGQNFVTITLGEGDYEISNMKSFLCDLDAGAAAGDILYQSALQVDRNKTKGNVIAGTLDAKEAGDMITTIPYDSNFEITVDGKKVTTEKVNTAFLGFSLTAGKHEITMVYHAAGRNAGMVLSVIGWICFVVLLKKF